MKPALRAALAAGPFPRASSHTILWQWDPTSDANLTLSGASVQQCNDMSGNSRNATASGTAGPDRVTGGSGINNVNVLQFIGANNDALTFQNALSMLNGADCVGIDGIVQPTSLSGGGLLHQVIASVSGNRFGTSFLSTGVLHVSTKRVQADTQVNVDSVTAILSTSYASYFHIQVDLAEPRARFIVDDAIDSVSFSPWASGAGPFENLNSATAPTFGRVGSTKLNALVGPLRLWRGFMTVADAVAQRLTWQATFATPLQTWDISEPTLYAGAEKVYQYA